MKYWAGKLLQCASANALTRYKNKFSFFFAFTIDICEKNSKILSIRKKHKMLCFSPGGKPFFILFYFLFFHFVLLVPFLVIHINKRICVDFKKALLVLTERTTRQEIIERMPDRTEESTIKALDRIERRFGALFRKVFKTITVDNGGEFSNVERLEQSVIRKGKRTHFYYCHPYSSFERGSNENQNRMIRRRYPKGTDFGKVSTAAIKNLEQWINNYPREILGWKTSAMCFRECLDAL